MGKYSLLIEDGHGSRTPLTRPQTIAAYLSRRFVLAVLVMVVIWASNGRTDLKFLGGLNLSGEVFNWHPLLLTIGIIVIFSEVLLSGRTCPFGEDFNRIFFVISNGIIMTAIGFGLKAVSTSQAKKNLGTLYSLHSWLGVIVVVLFSIQFVLGVFVNFHSGDGPRSALWERRKLVWPYFENLKILTFVTGCFTAIIGITLKNASFGCSYSVSHPDTNPAEHYNLIPDGCKLSNGLGIVIFIVLLLTLFAVLDVQRRDNEWIDEDARKGLSGIKFKFLKPKKTKKNDRESAQKQREREILSLYERKDTHAEKSHNLSFHSEKSQSTADLGDETSGLVAAENWQHGVSQGKDFWYNPKTSQTVWEKPEGVE